MPRSAVLAALLTAAVLAACGGDAQPEAGERPAATPSAGRVLTADDRSFERVAVEPDGPVLVLFFAPWSGPDRIILDYLAPIARERRDLRVVKVDVDQAPSTAQRYNVLAIPTAVVLRGGELQGEPVTGALPRQRWERELGLDSL